MRSPWTRQPSQALLDRLARLSPEAAERLLDSGALDEEILRHAAHELPADAERFSDLVPFEGTTRDPTGRGTGR